MQFHSAQTARTYNDRTVDPSWQTWATAQLAPLGKDIVDIGCGAGIYTQALAIAGAHSVVGVDASAQYVEEARQRLGQWPQVSFAHGRADATTLPDQCADLVFERALIHHLNDDEKAANIREVHRLLRPGGLLVVQDRTLEDVLATEPMYWIRATLFELFPQLITIEKGRRPLANTYRQQLQAQGFQPVQIVPYAEIRKQYHQFTDLKTEILSRKGKSLLFQLNDSQLQHYCQTLQQKAETDQLPLIEIDPWTVWVARVAPATS